MISSWVAVGTVFLAMCPAAHGFRFGFGSAQSEWPTEYGVDTSFPIHGPIDQSKYPFFYGNYQKFMEGCYKTYSRLECDQNENSRMAMNRAQPQTQHNYTEVGFKKLSVPEEAWEPLINFYKENIHKEKPESWPRGNTYVNHWARMPSMISFEDTGLRGGAALKNKIWNAIKPIIEEWVGCEVVPTSLYGIRVYKDGNILSTHVDRLPLVSSAIIQVDQDVDEPWPLEVYDHAGRAHNISMAPRDLVLYESHTVLHGRPFPLKGQFYANVFVHFKPANHDAMNAQDADAARSKKLRGAPPSSTSQSATESLFSFFSRGKSNPSSTSSEASEQAKSRSDAFRRPVSPSDSASNPSPRDSEDFPSQNEPPAPPQDKEISEEEQGEGKGHNEEDADQEPDEELGQLNIARIDDERAERWERLVEAIQTGDLMTAMGLVEDDNQLVDFEDDNKWTALHEAIRAGDTKMVKYLLSKGANVHRRVRGGGDALAIADIHLPNGHPIIAMLKEHARNSSPER